MTNSNDADRPSRLWNRRWLIGAAALVAFGLFYARPWADHAPLVRTERLSPQTAELTLALNGRIEPRHEVKLRAETSARILAVEVDEGDAVQAGDVLIRLDPALIEARLAQARAALDVQTVREALAESTATRARGLSRSAISQASLDEAEVGLAEARSETQRLRAALAQVEEEARQYTIRAPIDGTVLLRKTEPGQIATQQDELLVIADLSAPILRTDVDETHSARIEIGLPATLLPVGRSVPVMGHVSFAAPRIEASTGGRAIEIAFDEPLDLPIGLSVAANLRIATVENALSIPREALVLDGAAQHVLVVADEKAERRVVTIEDWPAPRVVVTSGLEAGEVVILEPGEVSEGQRVRAQ